MLFVYAGGDKRMTNEIEMLRVKLKEYELLIEELSAPIIPSIIPDTILVPLMGTLTEQRFQLIQTKILESVTADYSDTILIDFTGISLKDVNQMGLAGLSHQVTQLKKSLDIMGVDTIFSGFSPEFVRAIVGAGVDVNRLNAHANFRMALRNVMKEKRLDFMTMK